MGESLFCKLCKNPVFQKLPGRSCADKCEEKTDCPKGDVAKKFDEISAFINHYDSKPAEIYANIFKIIEDKETCYDDKDFVDFCVDVSVAAKHLFFIGNSGDKKPLILKKMNELNKKPRKPEYQTLITKMLMISTDFKQDQRGGKRRRRRKSRSKSRKSRRKSRKTKRKRRKSRKTKKRRRRRR